MLHLSALEIVPLSVHEHGPCAHAYLLSPTLSVPLSFTHIHFQAAPRAQLAQQFLQNREMQKRAREVCLLVAC